MYSITVNINGKPHTKDVPQSWNDLQWVDYIHALTAETQNETDVDGVLEALTGIPKNVLVNMQPYDHRFILTQCSFFWSEPPVMAELPTDFVRVHIENDTWQNLIDAEQEFKRVTELKLPQIAAAQLIIKTYSGIDIKGMSVPHALAYWDFFFGNSLIGQRNGKDYMTQNQMKTKLQQGLRDFKRLNGLQPFTLYRRVTQQNMTPFSKPRPTSSIQRYYLRKLNRNIRRDSVNTMSL